MAKRGSYRQGFIFGAFSFVGATVSRLVVGPALNRELDAVGLRDCGSNQT